MAEEPYARIPLAWHDWPLLASRSDRAQLAWVKMLSSYEMKRACVGLFPGGLSAFSDVTKIPFGAAAETLDELVEHRLVEHDPVHRIIRFLALPSRAERPPNGSCVVRWWKGFEMVPRCPTRDRHASLIRWLCHPMTGDHEKAWKTTFGTVELPDEQSATSDTVSQVSDLSSNQRNLFDDAKVWGGVGGGVRHHPRHPRYRSEVEVEVQGEEHEEREISTALAEGTSPGLRKPPLRSVPQNPTISAQEMLGAIAASAGGRVSFAYVDSGLRPALDLVASQCAANGLTLADLDLAGRFLHAGGLGYRNDLGASWAAKPGSVLDLVAHAQRWKKGDLVLEESDDGPHEPNPPSAFTTGIRVL